MTNCILAAVMAAPRRPIEIREFPSDLPPGGALLRTARSEVCGTDVHLWHGRLAGVPYPIIPGHVSAGTLEKMRGAITGIDGSVLREGDRVVFFDVHRTCGRCRACTVHRTPTRCPARRVYGITDPAAEGLFGGWAQAIYLEPGVGIARLPDAVGFEDYIGGGCGPAHRGARARAGGAPSRRQRARPGRRRRRPERRSPSPAWRCVDDGGHRGARRSSRARRADGRRRGVRHAATTGVAARGGRARTHGEGADVVIEAAGSPGRSRKG